MILFYQIQNTLTPTMPAYNKIAGTKFDTETMNNFEQLFKKLEIPPLDKTN